MSHLKTKASTNVLDETYRKHSHTIAKAYVKAGSKFGRITEVDKKLYLAKIELDEGILANGGDWIPITNSWLEMTFLYGTLREKLRVVVEYEGDQDNQPTAKVVGLEGEPAAAQKQETPSKATALYELFMPG